jgi:hypothetical protein
MPNCQSLAGQKCDYNPNTTLVESPILLKWQIIFNHIKIYLVLGQKALEKMLTVRVRLLLTSKHHFHSPRSRHLFALERSCGGAW